MIIIHLLLNTNCFDISKISKYRFDIDILYRIISPAEISKFSIYRYLICDTLFCRIFMYSFIYSRLKKTTATNK